MNDAPKAVFLSYASQDTETAKRIADALRAAGVEVWFDQSELVGGDAWDAKIRRQISSCALFVPVISVNTQARLEGYFRLEWKIAAQRTHTMADERVFLLPVVIDETRDAEAKVPAEFKGVQWTRLPGGGTPAAFCQRIQGLLTGVMAAGPTGGDNTASVHAPLPSRRRPVMPYVAAVIGIAVSAAILAFWKTQASRPGSVPPPVATAPQSEAQRLVQQARALIDEDLMAGRENYRLAAELCQKAVALDPADGVAWAIYARVASGALGRNYDTTPQQRELVRSLVDRAVRLAPASVETALARATQMRRNQDRAVAEQLLRAADPDKTDYRVQSDVARLLTAETGRTPERVAEALAIWQRWQQEPATRVEALCDEAGFHWSENNLVDADQLVARAQAIAPSSRGFSYQLLLAGYGWCDMIAARAVIATLPSSLLQEDVVAGLVAGLWLRMGDGARALEALNRVPRDFFSEQRQFYPKAYRVGWAQQISGKPLAAAAEWRQALKVVEERMQSDPNRSQLLRWRAQLLALLGENEPALAAWRLYQESQSPGNAVRATTAAEFYLALGDRNAAVQALVDGRDQNREGLFLRLEYDPEFAPIRDDPQVRLMITEAKEFIQQIRARGPVADTLRRPVPTPSAQVSDKSVAVLAFANLSSDKEQEYFSDGISEELLNVLAKVPGLKVTARTSAFHFKGKDTPIPEIAKQLGVAYVVEGSVRKAGDKVRITAQLIKAADGFHVWSDTFTRDLKDVFAVQDEIAGLIAKNLSLRLGTDRPTSGRVTVPEAYEFYLQGRAAWNLRTREGYVLAESALSRAVDLDPGFARAHSALADVWAIAGYESESDGGTYGWRNSPTVTKVAAKAEQALALDPNCAEAYTTLALALESGWKWEAAERAYRQSIELNPNYATARHWFGMMLWVQGRMDEAFRQMKQATESDPLSHRILDTYARMLNQAGRHEEALVVADRALALQPMAIQAATQKAHALVQLERIDEGVALIENALKPDASTEQRTNALIVLKLAGADTVVRRIIGSVEELPTSQFKFASLIALGRPGDALSELRTADLHENQLVNIALSQFYDPIRDDPRFLKAIDGIGYMDDYRRARVWLAANSPKTSK